MIVKSMPLPLFTSYLISRHNVLFKFCLNKEEGRDLLWDGGVGGPNPRAEIDMGIIYPCILIENLPASIDFIILGILKLFLIHKVLFF